MQNAAMAFTLLGTLSPVAPSLRLRCYITRTLNHLHPLSNLCMLLVILYHEHEHLHAMKEGAHLPPKIWRLNPSQL